MQLLFIDYTNLVLKAYEDKRESNRLSRLLIHPTTANLRQECLNVYNERFKKGQVEEDILRAFFGVPPAGKSYDYIIERYPADRLRPLRSFINRRIKNPALANVEMLAWLIDFNPRPLDYAQKVMGKTNEIPPANSNSNAGAEQKEGMTEKREQAEEKPDPAIENKATLSKDDGATTPVIKTKNDNDLLIKKPKASTNNNKIKMILAIGVLLAVSFGGIYSFQQYRADGQTAFGNMNTGCMYWANDHYQQVPCNEERKGRLFLPLEKEKINSFRRITRKDTITAWSIGKMYYIKDNNIIKYYTEPGHFPEDMNRTLKKLSRYIFEKDSINRKIPD
jgi:hypothetical protein